MNIRKAMTHEADDLSNLVLRSKAYWGYSEAFLEACRETLKITPAQIASSHVVVAEEDGLVKGVYILNKESDSSGLLHSLFIDSSAIGKGYGKALWNDMIETAAVWGLRTILIHSDPYAERFYLLMGAKRIGEVASAVSPDRKLPLMEFAIRR